MDLCEPRDFISLGEESAQTLRVLDVDEQKQRFNVKNTDTHNHSGYPPTGQTWL